MNGGIRHTRWPWPLVGLVAAAALVIWGARLGSAKPASTPLWTEHPTVTAEVTGPPAPPWVELAKRLTPAVVNVSTKRVERGVPGDPFEQFFRQFFGQESEQAPHTVRSLGSGFIINPAGYIVTNDHVVDDATVIRVKLSDGRDFAATLVGRDPKTDIGLLKIDAADLPVIPLGDSSQLQVGEPVMAIGNPFGLGQTVTTGIVSATGRVIGAGPYDDFIQTDASINPGNSGGPLINRRGQAIGINTVIISQGGGSVGIGFAIPVDLAKPVLTQLASIGHVVRSWLGVEIQSVTPDLAKSFDLPGPTGALVAAVVDGSPAKRAGVRVGDVITGYDGHDVASAADLQRAVANTPVGAEVPLTVLRNGRPLMLSVRAAKLAEPTAPARTEGPAETDLGLSVRSLTPELAHELGTSDTRGVVVQGVTDDSPAADAGLQPGDVIVRVDRHPVASVAQLKERLQKHHAGAPILLLVHRQGGSLFLTVHT
jgi:serine protease Do